MFVHLVGVARTASIPRPNIKRMYRACPDITVFPPTLCFFLCVCVLFCFCFLLFCVCALDVLQKTISAMDNVDNVSEVILFHHIHRGPLHLAHPSISPTCTSHPTHMDPSYKPWSTIDRELHCLSNDPSFRMFCNIEPFQLVPVWGLFGVLKCD